MNSATGPASPTLQPPAPLHSGKSGAVRVCKVVICDDQPELRDSIRFTLAATQWFIVIADAVDADSCLNRVRETLPDLLILDVNMPGGGPHIAAAAKAIHPRLHIVVFSGRADGAIQHAMLAAGADQYVLKTGRVAPLLQALDNAYRQLTTETPVEEVPSDVHPGGIRDHDEHLLDDQRCGCGSTVMYRRRTVMGALGSKLTFAAWCTTGIRRVRSRCR